MNSRKLGLRKAGARSLSCFSEGHGDNTLPSFWCCQDMCLTDRGSWFMDAGLKGFGLQGLDSERDPKMEVEDFRSSGLSGFL